MKSLKICLAAAVLSLIAIPAWAAELPYGAHVIKTGLGVSVDFNDRYYARKPYYTSTPAYYNTPVYYYPKRQRYYHRYYRNNNVRYNNDNRRY